tara:strand:- start:45 stop:455 length:411 start_codon:yes stop_codon:yes gene_type:complete
MNVPRSNDSPNHTPEDRKEGESETTQGDLDENGLDRLEAFLQLAILMNDSVAKNTNPFETPKQRTPPGDVDSILAEMNALNNLVSKGNSDQIKMVVENLIQSGPSSSPGFNQEARARRLTEYRRIAKEEAERMADL